MSLSPLNYSLEKQNIRYHFEYDPSVFENVIWTWDKEQAQKAPCYETVYLYRDNEDYYKNVENIEKQSRAWTQYIRENL